VQATTGPEGRSAGIERDQGHDQIDALRGRLIDRVRDQIREASAMTDTRATERLLELVAERGDTLVAFRDLEEVVELARRAGVESEALDRLERKLGGRPRRGKA
jgi:hypothetical protein